MNGRAACSVAAGISHFAHGLVRFAGADLGALSLGQGGHPNFGAVGTSTEPPLLPSLVGHCCGCQPCAPEPQLIPLSLAGVMLGSPRGSWPPLTPPLPLPAFQNMPNVRDHDASVYLRLQGDALSVGGYESNPIFWEEVRRAGRFSWGTRQVSREPKSEGWAQA